MANHNVHQFAQVLKEVEHSLIYLSSLIEQMSYIVSHTTETCLLARDITDAG